MTVQKPTMTVLQSGRLLWLSAALLGTVVLTGCLDTGMPDTFTEDEVLAGTPVSAATLNRGAQDYTTFCVQCHGDLGDGAGHAAAAGLWPPPRNFQQAQFKFTMTEQGELPSDDELLRIVKHGLNGTAMRPWDISDERLRDILQYIKTFAPDTWADPDAEPGELIEMSQDPHGAANRDAAVKLGEQVYHTYGCYTCHPTYVTPREIERATESLLGTAVSPKLRANWHRTELKESTYGTKVLPPDFTWHRVRTVNPEWPRDEQVQQMYRIVAAGINGAAMPAWKEIMGEDQMWGLAYYLQWLTELRDSPERRVFWERLGVDPTQDTPPYSASEAAAG